MPVRILFMNSGGDDCNIMMQLIMQDNPTAEFESLNIETDDVQGMEKAKELAEKLGVPHTVLPYNTTRRFLIAKRGLPSTTTLWSFNLHFLGLQYALSNDFDYIASGHDANPVNQDFEDILNAVMANGRFTRKIGILRPMRHVTDSKGREEFKAKVKHWKE